MWCLIEQNCQESHKRKDFAESLCCIRKQGFESASADCCRVKSVAPCSPQLHLSLARFASYSTLTFFFFFLLRCNFFPKTHPVVFISLVLLVTLSRCLSVFQPSYCEKPLQTNSPLSLIDSLSLSVSLPFFSAVLLLWAVRYIHFSLQSFTIFPTFFLPFFHPFFFLISYSSALLNPLPSCPNTFVPSELIILRDKTRTATCTNRSPSRARSDPELRTQNGLSPSSSICAFRYSFAILFLFFS